VSQTLWDECLVHLERELSPQQFNTWIRPLHAVSDDQGLRLLAPNRFVKDWIDERFLNRISESSINSVNPHQPYGWKLVPG
jgi:chromosomal replication initiator protein